MNEKLAGNNPPAWFGVNALPSTGGGDHATTKLIKWQIEGVDPGFDHSAPLDASRNALGPFAVGQTIKIMTEVSNSSGTRTSAVRSRQPNNPPPFTTQ